VSWKKALVVIRLLGGIENRKWLRIRVDVLLARGLRIQVKTIVLLRWRKFEARSVAVFLLTCHRGAGGGGRCRKPGLLIHRAVKG